MSFQGIGEGIDTVPFGALMEVSHRTLLVLLAIYYAGNMVQAPYARVAIHMLACRFSERGQRSHRPRYFTAPPRAPAAT